MAGPNGASFHDSELTAEALSGEVDRIRGVKKTDQLVGFLAAPIS
jgi:hypothetical protein